MFFIAALSMARVAIASMEFRPQPTPPNLASRLADQGFTPRPTDGPDLRLVHPELVKRDFEPRLCGYESGLSGR